MTVLYPSVGQSNALTSKGEVMISQVRFFSEEQACSMGGNAFTGMISITGLMSSDAPLGDGWGCVLRLKFDDVEKEWQGYIPMSEEQADEILSWLMTNEDLLKAVYVHCAAGESRSAAVAMFIADVYGLPIDPNKAKNYNRHVYALLNARLKERKLV